MFCTNCGEAASEGNRFCTRCGALIEPAKETAPPQAEVAEPSAIATTVPFPQVTPTEQHLPPAPNRNRVVWIAVSSVIVVALAALTAYGILSVKKIAPAEKAKGAERTIAARQDSAQEQPDKPATSGDTSSDMSSQQGTSAEEEEQPVIAARVAEAVLSIHDDVLNQVEQFNKAVGSGDAAPAALSNAEDLVVRARRVEEDADLIDDADPDRSDALAAARAYTEVAEGIRDAQEAWNETLEFGESSRAHRIVEDEFWPARERAGWTHLPPNNKDGDKYHWQAIEDGPYDRMVEIAESVQ